MTTTNPLDPDDLRQLLVAARWTDRNELPPPNTVRACEMLASIACEIADAYLAAVDERDRLAEELHAQYRAAQEAS
jgi:hypothetical protein